MDYYIIKKVAVSRSEEVGGGRRTALRAHPPSSLSLTFFVVSMKLYESTYYGRRVYRLLSRFFTSQFRNLEENKASLLSFSGAHYCLLVQVSSVHHLIIAHCPFPVAFPPFLPIFCHSPLTFSFFFLNPVNFPLLPFPVVFLMCAHQFCFHFTFFVCLLSYLMKNSIPI